MDWNGLYYPRDRYPFLDPHLSWPRLPRLDRIDLFSYPQTFQGVPDPLSQDPFLPLRSYGNESKIIPNSPTPHHYQAHLQASLHHQNFAFSPVNTRLTIDVNTSRFIPSLPSGRVPNPYEPHLNLACQATVNLSPGTHLQTLQNVPSSAATSFLARNQFCDPNIPTFGLSTPSPCHLNGLPNFSPRVDTHSAPLAAPIPLRPKTPLPVESLSRLPIDEKPKILRDKLLSKPSCSAASAPKKEQDVSKVIAEELRPIKKEVVDEEYNKKRENEHCARPEASDKDVKIPCNTDSQKEEKKETAKAPTKDLKQLKFLSSKNVNKKVSKNTGTTIITASTAAATQSSLPEKVAKCTTEKAGEESNEEKKKVVGVATTAEARVPTRTIEVQCDGPDWTPCVLHGQIKNRVLKTKKKDEVGTKPDDGAMEKIREKCPSPLKEDLQRTLKKSKHDENQKTVKNKEELKEKVKTTKGKGGEEKIKNVKRTNAETDSSSILPSNISVSLKASPKTAETMTQITPKRKMEDSGKKKKGAKKAKSDINDVKEQTAPEKSKNVKKGRKVETGDKDGEGEEKPKKKKSKKQKLNDPNELNNKAEPLDQIKVPSVVPSLKLNKSNNDLDGEGEQMIRKEEKRKDSLSHLSLPPPPPLQLINAAPASSSPAAAIAPSSNNHKQEGSDKKAKKESVKSSAGGKIPCSNVRQRKIKSGLDMIRNRKKKVKVPTSPSPPSSKVNSPEAHQVLQSSVTKRLSVNRAIGETVLHRAARLGYKDIVISVLSNCDIEAIDARDNAGYTPLHECSARGHFEIAQLLLSHGADVNAAAAGGIKPIHDAVEGDHVQLVRLLLSYGADPSISTYAGETPLNLAKSRTMTEFIRGFLTDLNGESPDGKAVLPWKFVSSSFCIDQKVSRYQGFDCLKDAPRRDLKSCGKGSKGKEVKIEESDRPFCPSFWLPPSLIEHRTGSPASSAETSNYLLLSDVLHHLKVKKEDFYRRFRDQVRIISVPGEEFDSKATCNQVLSSVPSSLRRITGQPLRGSKNRRGSQDVIPSGNSSKAASHQATEKAASTDVDVVLLNDSLRTILDIQVTTVR